MRMERALRERHTIVQLVDVYGSLLTPKQRRLLELYYFQDLSLGEIAERYGITRQAVYDSVRRSIQELRRLERNLGVVGRNRRMEHLATRLERAERLLVQFMADLRESSRDSRRRQGRSKGLFRVLLRELRMIRENLRR
ncbi:MAG: sigma factor-like helix-turn-helix DNA-binding protein [Armatimonadota bacterium]|nr:sigma factor-like helix-turn-helix DNA-binding protein [Armatimonadota bacterium]MDR7435133.1 sigma factor-like helix-turn-helix DNA-binding protein [Armatimonadota bacterium]